MTWKLQDAKNRFSEVVEEALKGHPQHVTRRGKPAVVVLSEADYARLARLETEGHPGFAEMLLEIPQDDEGLEAGEAVPRDVDGVPVFNPFSA